MENSKDETVVKPEENNPSAKPKKSKKKYILLILLFTIFIFGGLVAAFLLIPRYQYIREKAAIPGGVAKMFLTPESKSVEAGESFQANILFDTSGYKASGLTLRLLYPFEGDQPPISASDISYNTDLVTDGSWEFPYQKIYTSANNIIIELAGLNNTTEGYATQGQEVLATITFQANKPGTITVAFDEEKSVIADKTSATDILVIPQSQGNYTVLGDPTTPTPEVSASPAATDSAIPTATPATGSGTTIGNASPTPSPLPVTGFSTPTLFGIGVGFLLILGSLAIAL